MPKYRIVTDIATGRMIYFTDSFEKLHTDEYSVVHYYEGELPADMTRFNTWRWKFLGEVILDTEPPAGVVIPILENNKSSIAAFFKQELEKKVALIAPTVLEAIMYAEAELALKEEYVHSSWVATIASDESLNMTQAAYKILEGKKAKYSKLFKLELLRRDIERQISRATQSEQLFTIKQTAEKQLREITI